MRTFLVALAALLIGYQLGRADVRYGTYYGLKAGQWVRSLIINPTDTPTNESAEAEIV